jgi:hypothetical protein
MKKFLLFLILVFGFSAAASGHSAMDRFWGELPVDMLLTGDVLVVKPLIVPEDVTLTIGPGTVVRFEKNKDGGNRIIVRGELIARGSREKPIRFVPKDNDSGPWYGVEFQGAGHGRLEHCVVVGASAGIKDPGKKAAIREVVFR